MTKLQWQNFPYGKRGAFVDVDGVGRYSVAPVAKGARIWRAALNARPLQMTGSKDDVIAMVENVVRTGRPA